MDSTNSTNDSSPGRGGGRVRGKGKRTRRNKKVGKVGKGKKGGSYIRKSVSNVSKTMRRGVTAIGTGIKSIASRIGSLFTGKKKR